MLEPRSKVISTDDGLVQTSVRTLYAMLYVTQDVHVFFSVPRSARMNKFDFTTEEIDSVHMTVFESVAHHNVDNWIQLLT